MGGIDAPPRKALILVTSGALPIGPNEHDTSAWTSSTA